MFAVAVGARLAVALVLYGQETNDTMFFRVQADTVLAGQSPYSLTSMFANYPPFWLYLVPAGVRVWSNLLGWPMDFGIKLLPILMDGFISALIYIWLRERGSSDGSAIFWSLAYGLNPVSIFNNAVEGQIDSLPMGLALLAALIFLGATYRWQLLGALTLGFGVLFKIYPLMFVPFFIWELVRRYGWHWGKILSVVGLVMLPWLLSMAPLLWIGQDEALIRTVRYMFLESGAGGSGKFGLLGVVKWSGLPVAKMNVDTVSVPASWGIIGQALVWSLDLYRLLLLTKALFGAGYLLLCSLGRKIDLTLSMLLSMLLIFVFIGGFYNYYPMWLLPLAMLKQQRFAIVYSILATALIATELPAVNFLFWGTCCAWLIYLAVDLNKQNQWTTLAIEQSRRLLGPISSNLSWKRARPS